MAVIIVSELVWLIKTGATVEMDEIFSTQSASHTVSAACSLCCVVLVLHWFDL